MEQLERERGYRDGRDEMNLADFPISALQRVQKSDGQGGKLDRMEFTATRYDPATRQRVRQKVTLTSTARDGLPTPADEHVILALLYVAKHSNNFDDATVQFAPSRLFEIMGWAPNGRSYARLRDVLRRLKALTIRYENAWWDVVGRAYEEEVATGIISAYRIARQTSGPRREGQPLESWVTWTQSFHDSLRAGNLKRLDLDVFFRLQTPTAQRMYRFLDKRFYTSPTVAMDLVEFACGHVGLTDAGNVAILKRRLAPAIGELEAIGFLKPAAPEERYQKVRVGQWRVVLERAAAEPRRTSIPACPSAPGQAGMLVLREEVAREFYRLWDATNPAQPGPRDLEQADVLLRGRTAEEAMALLALLVKVTRKEWPECRSLSGAVQKYLADALALAEAEARREAERREAEARRALQRQESESSQRHGERLERLWRSMPEAERQAVEARVRQRVGGHAPAGFVHRLCLDELARDARLV
jgi:hypothetical protein